MIVNKASLLKTLRTISSFDAAMACAYLGVQLPNDTDTPQPQLHRSSPEGFVQTSDFNLMKLDTTSFSSLTNLKDLLSITSSDDLELILDPNTGQLRVISTEDGFSTRLQVFSLKKDSSGFKYHYVGDPTTFQFPGDTFKGFDIHPFKGLTQSPTVLDGRLLVSTISGSVIWTGSDSLKKVKMQPREGFLRFISGVDLSEVLISKQGYWLAEKEGLVCASSVHDTPTELLSLYGTPGKEVVQFNAHRLLSSLSSAAYLSSDSEKIELNPREGIVCRDKYTNVQVLPMGESGTNWAKVTIYGRTAKLIVDALSQTSEETAVLYIVPLRTPTYRIVRGSFEVNFGLVI